MNLPSKLIVQCEIFQEIIYFCQFLSGKTTWCGGASEETKTVSIFLSVCLSHIPRCACFAEIWLKYFEFHILWSLSSVDFHTLTLQLPIQTPNCVAPELQAFVSSLAISAKQAHPWVSVQVVVNYMQVFIQNNVTLHSCSKLSEF